MKKEDILRQFYDGTTQQWDLELDDIALIPAIYDELASMKQKYILTMQATAQYCRIEIRKETYDLGDDPVCYVNESSLNYLCKKAVPIGIDSYEELRNGKFYCVDKTRMIEGFLLSGDKVTLITRPRRFGKTLNMSMLAAFFDMTKNSKLLFKDTYIAKTVFSLK